MAWDIEVDRFGRTHENCYAPLTGLQFDFANKTVQMVFTVWVDANARDSKEEPIKVICVPVTGADFDSWEQIDTFKAESYERSASDDAFVGAVAV